MRVRYSDDNDNPITVNYTVQECHWEENPKTHVCEKWANEPIIHDREFTYIPRLMHEEIHDVETPNFYRCIKEGQIINNPLYQLRRVDIDTVGTRGVRTTHSLNNDCCPVNFRWDSLNAPCSSAGTYLSHEALEAAFASDIAEIYENTSSLSLTKAWANCSAADIQSLAMLGELPETVSSLVSILKRVATITRLLRKKDYVKLAKTQLTAKQLADRYMEARYALRPLVYDFVGTLNAINTLQKGKRKPRRYSFYGMESASKTFEKTIDVVFSNLFGCTLVLKCIHGVDSRSGVLANISVSNPISILGLDQVFESAWELIPFSFIIDWFINVGDTIASWTPNYGIDPLSSFTTTKVTTVYTMDVTCPRVVDIGHYDTCEVSCTGHIQRTVSTKTREPNPTRDILPSFSLKLDVLKLLDLGIILKNLKN